MIHSTLKERLKIYVNTTTKCLMGLVLLSVIAVLIAFLSLNVGIGMFMLSLIFVFGFFHLHLAKSLIPQSSKLIFYILPVIILSVLLLTFKVIVNTTINYGCLNQIPEMMMLLNYILYTIWSGIFLWEIYIALIQKCF